MSFTISVLAGVVSMLLLMIILKPEDWVAVAIGAAILVFLYFALYFGLKLQRLPMGHSSRFESVLFGAAETKQTSERNIETKNLYQGAVQSGLQTFLFTNPQYTQVFCESNEHKASKPLEIVFRNSAPIRSMATLDRHKVSGFLRAIVTYLLIAFIAFWLNMSYGVFRNVSFEKEEILPEKGTIFGRVIDAVNGNPLSQVQINISNESNELISSLTSDEQGTYSVTFPAGSYHAIFSKDGYETASQIFLSVSGKQIENQDCALSPIIAEGHLRIVLQWGALPKDLDAHLINKDHNIHVFYKSLIAMQNGDKIAELELDDTDSYGPETLHILIPLTGKYVYCVHDYTNRNSNLSNKLAASGATVTVYLGDNKKQEFTVPDKPGTCWEVFSLENGIITPINEMSYISDETLVGQ